MNAMEGLTTVITGAAGGIGLGIARHFAASGADVIGWDIAPTVERAMADIGARGAVCDIADPEAVAAALASVPHARVATLVNAAGVHRPAEFLEMELADFDLIMRVNVWGTVIPTQAVARRMVASGVRGSIVNLASVAAEHVTPVSTAYASSKGAIVSFTRGAAMSLARHGIRVNAIAPGPVETPMNAERRKDAAYVARMIERVPLGRQGRVEDIAATAEFLGTSASSWITGEILHVDGGISVLR